jgi:hypothetical protein
MFCVLQMDSTPVAVIRSPGHHMAMSDECLSSVMWVCMLLNDAVSAVKVTALNEVGRWS